MFSYFLLSFLILPSVPNLFVRALCSGRSSFSDRVIRPDHRGCRMSTIRVCRDAWPSPGSRLCSANRAARRSSSSLPGEQQCCLRHCFAAGCSTADVLFSAKYDHLQVCAGVSIFISHYSNPAGFPLKFVPSC